MLSEQSAEALGMMWLVSVDLSNSFFLEHTSSFLEAANHVLSILKCVAIHLDSSVHSIFSYAKRCRKLWINKTWVWSRKRPLITEPLLVKTCHVLFSMLSCSNPHWSQCSFPFKTLNQLTSKEWSTLRFLKKKNLALMCMPFLTQDYMWTSTGPVLILHSILNLYGFSLYNLFSYRVNM